MIFNFEKALSVVTLTGSIINNIQIAKMLD